MRDAGLAAGVQIPSTCGGVGSCGLCKVRVTAGAEFLSDPTEVEISKLGNVFFITKERLSCQTRVSGGDVGCEVPEEYHRKAKKAQLRKDGYDLRNARSDRDGAPRRRG